jgi:hypothetical protein
LLHHPHCKLWLQPCAFLFLSYLTGNLQI